MRNSGEVTHDYFFFFLKKGPKFRVDWLKEKEEKNAGNVTPVLRLVTSGLSLAELPSGVLEAVFSSGLFA